MNKILMCGVSAFAVLMLSDPVMATDYINPAGTTITNETAKKDCGGRYVCALEAPSANDTLTNNGTIKLNSNVHAVYGFFTEIMDPSLAADIVVTNNGIVQVDGTDDFPSASATRLYINSGNMKVVNNGAISVSVNSSRENSDALGIGAGTDSGTVYINNNGPISVVNNSVPQSLIDARAVGISVNTGGGPLSSGGKAYIDSTKTVFSFSRVGIARQLSVGGGGTAYLRTWAMDLKPYASAPIQVGDNSGISSTKFHLGDGSGASDTGTRLIVGGGSVAGNHKFADFIEKDNAGTVTGKIGSVEGATPFIKASLSGNDWSDQEIDVSIDSQLSDGQAAGIAAVDGAQAQINRVATVLSNLYGQTAAGGGGISSGDEVSGSSTLQVRPYYGYQGRSGVASSNTDAVGVVVIGNRVTDAGHSFGFHVGLEHSTLQSDSKTLKINTMSGLLGAQGRYQIDGSAYVRGQGSALLSHNSNHVSTVDGSDTADKSTVNYGLYGAIAAGYDFKVDPQNIITPELGVSALWSHTPSLNLNFKDATLNQHYGSQDYTAVYGNASLRWTGGIDINGTLVRPTVMGGVRQGFTDGKVKSNLTFQGNHFSSSITEDRTVGVAQVGASLPLSATVDLSLTYSGEYGKRTTNHMGYANIGWRF